MRNKILSERSWKKRSPQMLMMAWKDCGISLLDVSCFKLYLGPVEDLTEEKRECKNTSHSKNALCL